MSMFQAYIDDSYDKNGDFVLAGYIASTENWEAFSQEWEAMLPYGVLNKYNNFHFKMSEMAQSADRMERVSGFYRIIENHVKMGIVCKINSRDLERARQRLYLPYVNIDWGYFSNLYLVTFRCLLDMFHTNRKFTEDILPLDQKIDFYFDNQTEKSVILPIWNDYISERPDKSKKYYGEPPRFEDDTKFLPIQAADFLAWWARKAYQSGDHETILNGDFGIFKNKQDIPIMAITFNEDQLFTVICDIIRPMLGPVHFIHDLKH